MLSTALQDYLKIIYKLEEQQSERGESDGRGISTSAIAERMGVSQASVTSMLKKLADKGYLTHAPYQGSRLTEDGRRIAVEMIRRHRIVELFLVDSLGFSWDEVDAEAEVLEHAVSKKVVDRMWEQLGCPEQDPHGSPIPSADGVIEELRDIRQLSEVDAGETVQVARIRNRSPEELRYLASLGLDLGAVTTLVEKSPFNGPLLIRVGEQLHALDHGFADSILVVQLQRESA